MPRPRDILRDLHVADLTTFLAVRRSESVSAAARELGVTPSQVSKAITRLETTIGVRLFSRGAHGVALSDRGRLILPHVEAAIASLEALERREGPSVTEITVAGPSYLMSSFLPVIAGCESQLRVRGIELAPSLVRAYAPENFFEMALLTRSAERLPVTWVGVNVGQIRLGLFGSPAVARRLEPFPTSVEKLRGLPFITPIYNVDGRYLAVEDDCPLPSSERRTGHSAQTIGIALELAARTDQLVFGPVVSARRLIATGALVEIQVRGWLVRDALYIACNADRVMAKTQTAVVKAMRAAASEFAL